MLASDLAETVGEAYRSIHAGMLKDGALDEARQDLVVLAATQSGERLIVGQIVSTRGKDALVLQGETESLDDPYPYRAIVTPAHLVQFTIRVQPLKGNRADLDTWPKRPMLQPLSSTAHRCQSKCVG